MGTDGQLQIEKLAAKVLMLETIQMSICTFFAKHPLMGDSFLDKVFDDAENELRVMAIAGNSGTPDGHRSIDLALVYLAENASAIRSALRKERTGRRNKPNYSLE